MAGDTGSLVADALGEMVLHTGQFGDLDTIDRQEVAAVGDVSATSLFLVSLAAAVIGQLLVVSYGEYSCIVQRCAFKTQ